MEAGAPPVMRHTESRAMSFGLPGERIRPRTSGIGRTLLRSHPDSGFALVGHGQQGDIRDQGAQQPLAVLGAGGRGAPQAGQVSGDFLQVSPVRQRRQRFTGGLQRLLGLGQGGEPGLPAGLQAAGDQPVLRLAGAKARSAGSAS